MLAVAEEVEEGDGKGLRSRTAPELEFGISCWHDAVWLPRRYADTPIGAWLTGTSGTHLDPFRYFEAVKKETRIAGDGGKWK
jgi:hypothetical protein